MSTNKHYKKAIELLTDPFKPLDYTKIVNALAASHPRIFVQLVTPDRQIFEVLKKEQWHRDARAYIEGGKLVEAIKLTRQATGLGLKEAKDVCDWAKHEMFPMTANGYAKPNLVSSHEEYAKLISA